MMNDTITGRVQEAVGSLAGDTKAQMEEVARQAAGAAEDAYEVRDRARDVGGPSAILANDNRLSLCWSLALSGGAFACSMEKNASSDSKPVTTATTQPATDGTTTTTPKTTEVKTGG